MKLIHNRSLKGHYLFPDQLSEEEISGKLNNFPLKLTVEKNSYSGEVSIFSEIITYPSQRTVNDIVKNSYSFRISSVGFIQFIDYFDVSSFDDLTLVSRRSDDMDEIAPKELELIQNTLLYLEQEKVLVLDKEHLFGNPTLLLERAIMKKFDYTYNYLSGHHIILEPGDKINTKEMKFFKYQLGQGYWMTKYSCMWKDLKLTSSREYHLHFAVDFLGLSVYTSDENAMAQYLRISDTRFILNSKEIATPKTTERIRNLVHRNNMNYQRIFFMERFFKSEDSLMYQPMLQLSDVAERANRRKKSEEEIKEMCNDIDNNHRLKMGLNLNILLGIVTVLTIGSIINDLHSLLVSENFKPEMFKALSLKSLFIGLGLVSVGFLSFRIRNLIKGQA